MKLQIRGDLDRASDRTEIFSDAKDGGPGMVEIVMSDGATFQIMERHRGILELRSVKKGKWHTTELLIIPRSSNLADVESRKL